MARTPQSAGAQKKAPRKRAAPPSETPLSPRALGIDDLMGEFAGPTATPAPSADLDDLLGELAGPAPIPAPMADLDALLDDLAAPPPVSASIDLDDILGELPAAAPIPAAEADPLDDLLGELVPQSLASESPTPESPPPESLPDLDDLLGDMAAPLPDAPLPDVPLPDGPPAPGRRRLALPRRLPAPAPILAGAVALFVACNAFSYWLGTLAHNAATPQAEASAEASGEASAEEGREEHGPPPAEGIARYAGKAFDTRIDGKTFLEDADFRLALDELVGGPEAADKIDALLGRVHGQEPIARVGTQLSARACNPEACGFENLTAEYDTASKAVSICVTQSTGDPPLATSWLYDEQGARDVPACEGYAAPPKPRQKRVVVEAEQDEPADLTLTPSSGTASIAERIHQKLAEARGQKRKRRYED